MSPVPSVAVINFNAPELHHLAAALANAGMLHRNVRLYANKGRRWERALESVPLIGSTYRSTFGRRRMRSEALIRATEEAGIVPDLLAACLGRASVLPAGMRELWTHALQESMRRALLQRGGAAAAGASSVVAYPGCALRAFQATKVAGGHCYLSYPIAHHRYHLRTCREEGERLPRYAPTWKVFERVGQDYFRLLDEEIALADVVAVGSSFVRETFITEGVPAAKLVVVPYGVDTGLFHATDRRRQQGFNVLFVGQISQRKGVGYLLAAYRRFQREGTSLTLVGRYVGPPTVWEEFGDLYSHITNLPRSELAQVYERASVFVFPTLLEGMPLVLLEAMASGLPVIVTDRGCTDIVRDGIDGIVVPAGDEVALLAALELLQGDESMRKQMGESARARALTYTWERYAAAMIELLTRAPAKSTGQLHQDSAR